MKVILYSCSYCNISLQSRITTPCIIRRL